MRQLFAKINVRSSRFWPFGTISIDHSKRVSLLFDECLPRLRSRPKFASDQTFQTKIISDQTFQTEIISDQTFQTEIISDQTFQTEGVLIRPSPDHGQDSNSDHCPDLNQTMIRPNFRPK